MRVRRLGPLEVSVVGLGCNNFGGRIDEAATFAVIDAAIDAGVTFFDTSDTYGNQGGSEELIGRALQGRRDQVVLATKWGKPMGDGTERRGSRDYILGAVEASLRRLQTDVIDLYQHHEEDPGTPLEETVATVEQLVAEGTVRAWGTSNYRAETVERVRALASDAYVSEQSEYSLLRRDAEADLLPRCGELGRVHPVLPARERAPDGEGLTRPSARRGHAPARSRHLGRRSVARREARCLGRCARPLAARGRDRLAARGGAGRVGDRRRDQARAGEGERRSGRLGTDGGGASRGVSHLRRLTPPR
jgi:aryl-alcohol dehydrogenase-like predicted oxidoreductase